MTESDKQNAIAMRTAGKSMKQIAEYLNLSVNTVKSYCRRKVMSDKTPVKPNLKNDPESCKHCGKIIRQNKKAKPKIYCCEQCRRDWWKANGVSGNNRKAFYQMTCTACGAVYVSYGNNKRKFCSSQCYIRSRFGSEGHDKRPV